jgi:hypothetical protein
VVEQHVAPRHVQTLQEASIHVGAVPLEMKAEKVEQGGECRPNYPHNPSKPVVFLGLGSVVCQLRTQMLTWISDMEPKL